MGQKAEEQESKWDRIHDLIYVLIKICYVRDDFKYKDTKRNGIEALNIDSKCKTTPTSNMGSSIKLGI